MQLSPLKHQTRQSGEIPGSAGAVAEDSPELPSEGPIGEAQSVQVAHGLPRMLLTVAVNVLVLAEVFIAMYFAAKNPDEITPIFFKTLFSMLLPTLVLAFIAKRVIARRGRQ